MAKKAILLVLFVVLIFSFSVNRADAYPRWWGPPPPWGFYEVHYYYWHPYHPVYYYVYPDYYIWYPWWYEYCDDYWEPDYYYYYTAGWYVSIWIEWGWHPYYPYYCCHPYWYPHHYYYPNYYAYYTYYNYHYPDYYWDGYRRWRNNYNEGHKPYRTNDYNGGGKSYAYHNWNGNPKPPKKNRGGRKWVGTNKSDRIKDHFEVAKLGQDKSIKKSATSVNHSVSRKSLQSVSKKRINKQPHYEKIVSAAHPTGVKKKKLIGSADLKSPDKNAAEKRGNIIIVKHKIKQDESDNKKQGKHEKKKISFERQKKPSNNSYQIERKRRQDSNRRFSPSSHGRDSHHSNYQKKPPKRSSRSGMRR